MWQRMDPTLPGVKNPGLDAVAMAAEAALADSSDSSDSENEDIKKKPGLDDVARRAMASPEDYDSSASESEDCHRHHPPMYQMSTMRREKGNNLKKDLESTEKELRGARASQRGAMRQKQHFGYSSGVSERSLVAEIARLMAENDKLKPPSCPICQDEKRVATWVAECGHRVCCDECVEQMYKCRNRCPICRQFMTVDFLRRLHGAGTFV